MEKTESESVILAHEWKALRSNLSTFNDAALHRAIVLNLLRYSFNLHDYYIEEKLLAAMPLYHKLIREVNLRRGIKCVKETATSLQVSLGNRYTSEIFIETMLNLRLN